MSKRIIFCDNSLFGLLNFRVDIIKHLVKKGYDIYLIAPDEGDFGKLIEPEGVTIIRLNAQRSSTNILYEAIYLFKIFFHYLRIKPNCVFHYTIKPNIYGTLSCKILGIKSVAVVAGLGYIFNENNVKNKLYRKLLKMALKMSYRVIVINEMIFNFLIDRKYVLRDRIVFSQYGEGINLKEFKSE